MTESAPNFNHNEIVYSVSEVSFALKAMVEDRFGVIKIRGEITGYKQASSGHCYFRLKDDDAVMDTVMWKGTASKLSFSPEDGLEVVISGKMTTYAGKSSYQVIANHMEIAGEGALMALLEKRKRMLEAEGLFSPARKQPLPYMPRVIGVVTSPTGAVIRDILHRIADRFPCHVIVYPVAVQGEGAAVQIAHAIDYFNSLPPESRIPTPDLLIVARGGGSLEDLWAFNEEVVVRAAANSNIPLISAVGHETDTTLIDFAADVRAPTPSAAAEMAVPVLADLKLATAQLDMRLGNAIKRGVVQREEILRGMVRGLPKPDQLLQFAMQKLDDLSLRHAGVLSIFLERKEQQLALVIHRLTPTRLLRDIEQHAMKLLDYIGRARQATLRMIISKHEQIKSLSSLLESMNVERVLERGFVLVRGDKGQLVTHCVDAKQQQKLELQFADGRIVR